MHLELRLPGRPQRLPRPGRALLRDRSATDTDGCTSGSLPLGTPVDVTGASKPGTLVYNSWLTMQANGEADANTCAYNDLALIKIDPADVGKVNPSVPGFGGPTGVGSWGGTGSTVYTYGNSELRGGVTALSPKQGVVIQNTGGGWSHDVYTVTPGHPGRLRQRLPQRHRWGDRRPQHRAARARSPASNGVGDLGERDRLPARARRLLRASNLVPGTEPFNADTVGAAVKGLGV